MKQPASALGWAAQLNHVCDVFVTLCYVGVGADTSQQRHHRLIVGLHDSQQAANTAAASMLYQELQHPLSPALDAGKGRLYQDRYFGFIATAALPARNRG